MQHEEYQVVFQTKPTLKKLYVEVTSRCNLSCIMCFQRSLKSLKGDMSEKTFYKILDDTRHFSQLSEWVFGGIGENFVHPHFLPWVEAVRQRNMEVTILTNGTLLDESIIERLIELDVSRLMISLDSPNPIEYDQIRGHNLEKLLTSIGKINQAKKRRGTDRPWITSEFVLMRNNFHSLPALVDLAAEYDIREINLTNLIPFTRGMVEQTLYHPEIPPDLDDVLAKARMRAYIGQVALKEPAFSLKTERHCQFIESYACAIGWRGQVSPCFRLLHSYNEYVFGREKTVAAFDFGLVGEKSLYDIWTSPAYMEFRYKIGNGIYPSCPDCTLVDGCDYIMDSTSDCHANVPSCADCLWTRNLASCP